MQLKGKETNIKGREGEGGRIIKSKKNQQKSANLCVAQALLYILYLYVPRIRFYVNFCYNGSKKIGANFEKNFSAILGI